jgi:hypothetical protein
VNSGFGTQYTYLAVRRASRLHIQHLVGKWNDESCLEFWEGVAKRLQIPTARYRLSVCTDSNRQNLTALRTAFPSNSVNYGAVKKIRRGQVVIGQVVRNVFGYNAKDAISIHHVDGYCARLRERISRYVRRSKTFSKKKTPFYRHLCLFQAYNNFIDVYKDDKTPCMLEGITARIWGWSDILSKYCHSSQ